MTWVKLDDQFPDHPKVIAAGPDAAWLYVAGLCFASKYLTDGFVPTHMLQHLTKQKRPEVLVARLVELGMWSEVDGGWAIHDYAKHQRTRAQIEAERAAASRRQSQRRHGVTTGEVTRPETEAETENRDRYKNAVPSSSEEAGPQAVDEQGLDEGGIATALRRGTSLAVELVASNGSNGKGRE